eukprot:scaffold842_cov357-Prasinococcus_capsulatus_cf.AAC.4
MAIGAAVVAAAHLDLVDHLLRFLVHDLVAHLVDAADTDGGRRRAAVARGSRGADQARKASQWMLLLVA